MKDNKILMIIFAIVLPPLAVFFQEGIGKHFVINVILCFIFWIPAEVHAVWLIVKDSEYR